MLTVLVPASPAVVATLLGAIVSGRFQERAAERQIRVTPGQTIRRDRLDAVTALACAASDGSAVGQKPGHRTGQRRRLGRSPRQHAAHPGHR
ncbi:hypothetical protein AB0F05_34445, partial [Streptomyces microflavus]